MGKPSSRVNHQRLVIGVFIGLTVLLRASVFAQTSTTRPAAKPAPRPTVNASVVVPQLIQAYNQLATADSDYQGHRDMAMNEIAATCQLLGRRLTPPVGVQTQHLSDLQIRSVQMVLLSIGRSVPPGDNNAPVVTHLNNAISQLDQGMTAQIAQSNGNQSNKPKGNPKAADRSGQTQGTRGPLIVDNPINTNMVQVGALEDIYETLSVADHDYKGHRVKAMNAISRVVKALGGDIHGDGHGHEEQIVSDQQLRYAQFLLKQVCQSFSTNDPKPLLDDLTTAYNQLTTALSIK